MKYKFAFYTFSEPNISRGIKAVIQTSERCTFACKDTITLLSIILPTKEAPALTSAPKATGPQRSLRDGSGMIPVSVAPAHLIINPVILTAFPQTYIHFLKEFKTFP